jgi:hypothetical protein
VPSHAISVRKVIIVRGGKRDIFTRVVRRRREARSINSMVRRIVRACFCIDINMARPLMIIKNDVRIYKYLKF